MFCPRCGKAEQLPETYCRQCGEFLPDISKLEKKVQTPQEHLKANIVLNIMTAVASITLAIWLYAFFLGRDNTPAIIYITAGFLTAIFAWQVQVFYRTLQLKKHFQRRKSSLVMQAETQPTNPLLEPAANRVSMKEADLNKVAAPSVTENTTKHLVENKSN